MTTSDYDDFANAYSVANESGLFNAYYERPAMLRLAGDVAGRRILDAGCGSGRCRRRWSPRGPVSHRDKWRLALDMIDGLMRW